MYKNFMLQTYKGKTIVRGKDADHWSTCLQWPNPNATFTLDYYFTGKVGKIVWENVALFGH